MNTHPAVVLTALTAIGLVGCGTATPRTVRASSSDESPVTRAAGSRRPSPGGTEGAAGGAPTCRPAQLVARVTETGSNLSNPYALVVLRNHGRRACSMNGYPLLQAFGHATYGHRPNRPSVRVPIRQHDGSTYAHHDPGAHLVTIAPASTASFAIGTASGYQGGEYGVTLTRLLIKTPGALGPISLRLELGTAHPRHRPTPVAVTAIQRGISRVN